MDYPPFPGFSDAGLAFLRDLATHNERTWFTARKVLFEDEVLDPARCLVADVARQARWADLPITGDPARSLFRIYRDTRFSKDKRPYKTHVGIVFSRSGDRRDEGVVYVHVEPGAAFVGAGFWRPDPALLRRWRARMAADPPGWLETVEEVAEAGLHVVPAEPLRRMPRGFEAEAEGPVAAWLRARSFLVRHPVGDDLLRSPALTATVLDVARGALPLLRYGWALLDG